MEEQFVQLTRINVESEVAPLDQVLSKVSVDAAQKLGQHASTTSTRRGSVAPSRRIDPRELCSGSRTSPSRTTLLAGFLRPLLDHIAWFGGR